MNLWWSLVDHPTFERDSLDQNWDVAIVGGGFSGLWTAHHLLKSEPDLKIAIFEMGQIGSGASGRNGGWVSGLYPKSDEALAKNFSAAQISDLHSQLEIAIDEIGDFAEREGIECGFKKGGTLTIATNGGQLHRLRKDLGFQGRQETISQVAMNSAMGSTYSPHCAAVNPAALIAGLANSLAKRGVAIFENHLAMVTDKKELYINGKRISANFVVLAVEAYLAQPRQQIPIYSLIVATEPLHENLLSQIGLKNRQTFSEATHLVTYAQLTGDNRIVVGGRGAPYSWGSRRRDRLESRGKDHERLRQMTIKWFPVLREINFTHAWGGAVGITRDWSPYVRIENNFGQMGGYVGDGMTLSYLAAAAMSDGALRKVSPRTKLPFVQWTSKKWEAEPWRWLSVNAAIRATFLADREEGLTQKPSLIIKALSPLLGR